MFACLSIASLGSLALYHRLRVHHRTDDTLNVVRMIANIFVVMTSPVLGLMINSAKNTLESVVETYTRWRRTSSCSTGRCITTE
jgi:hypothetical protein